MNFQEILKKVKIFSKSAILSQKSGGDDAKVEFRDGFGNLCGKARLAVSGWLSER